MANRSGPQARVGEDEQQQSPSPTRYSTPQANPSSYGGSRSLTQRVPSVTDTGSPVSSSTRRPSKVTRPQPRPTRYGGDPFSSDTTDARLSSEWDEVLGRSREIMSSRPNVQITPTARQTSCSRSTEIATPVRQAIGGPGELATPLKQVSGGPGLQVPYQARQVGEGTARSTKPHQHTPVSTNAAVQPDPANVATPDEKLQGLMQLLHLGNPGMAAGRFAATTSASLPSAQAGSAYQVINYSPFSFRNQVQHCNSVVNTLQQSLNFYSERGDLEGLAKISLALDEAMKMLKALENPRSGGDDAGGTRGVL